MNAFSDNENSIALHSSDQILLTQEGRIRISPGFKSECKKFRETTKLFDCTINNKESIKNFGMMLLEAALGGFEMFPMSGCNHQYQCCCLIHCSNKSEAKKKDLSIHSFLQKSRFSTEFIDFLCATIKNNGKSFSQLLQHPWMNKNFSNSATP